MLPEFYPDSSDAYHKNLKVSNAISEGWKEVKELTQR